MNSSKIYLSQTDTTVGFLSNKCKTLNKIKNRPLGKEVLSVVNSFNTLKLHTRIPNKYKKLIRNNKTTSYIYSNKNSYRVVQNDSKHITFLNKFKIMYSTSANEHNKIFDENYALDNSDIIIYTKDNFKENISSSIYKVSKSKLKKIR